MSPCIPAREAKYGAASQVPTTWCAGSPYGALFTAVDSSFPGKAWARSSEAMQIKKHATLTSNRFRFVRYTAKNSVRQFLRPPAGLNLKWETSAHAHIFAKAYTDDDLRRS